MDTVLATCRPMSSGHEGASLGDESWWVIEYPGGRSVQCCIANDDLRLRRALAVLWKRNVVFELPEAFFTLGLGAQEVILRTFVINRVLDWCPDLLTDDVLAQYSAGA